MQGYRPVIPTLRGQGQEDLCEFQAGPPGLHGETTPCWWSDASDQPAALRLWGRRKVTLGGGTAPRRRTEAQARDTREAEALGLGPTVRQGPVGLAAHLVNRTLQMLHS